MLATVLGINALRIYICGEGWGVYCITSLQDHEISSIYRICKLSDSCADLARMMHTQLVGVH